MNKQDWTYKKLGEICDLMAGGDVPKNRFSKEKNDIYKVPIYSNGVVNEGLYGYTDIPKITKNSITISGRGTIGFVAKRTEPFYPAIRLIVATPKDGIDVSYLHYCVISKHLDGNGVAIPQLTVPMVRKVSIPIPPIGEQERIVAELDLLQGIIEKKKEQLKAYDQLAQSIFYSMFGDPIDNPKGWETKTMSDVCASMTKGPFGSDIKKSLFVPKSKDTYKVYIQANAIEKDISLGDYYISKDYFENKMFRFEVKPNDYIITCDGTLGKYIRLPQCIERGIISASLLRLTLNDNINYRYFEHLWDYYILHQQIKDIRNTALKHLPSASKMGKTTIPLPPISLQEEFAEKVEAIEQQKALVQQSIEEVQTMFDCTMDKYFG